MARTPLFDRLMRNIRLAMFCEANRIATPEGLERAAEAEARAAGGRQSRREFLASGGKLAAAGALASLAGAATAAPKPPGGGGGPSVGIVGGGLAGLACADELRKMGVAFTLYEASNRFGGRIFSFPVNSFFTGQSAERGGEFIDTAHKTMLAYANEFNLAKEDVTKVPGEIYYFFQGQRHDETEVVDGFRAAVAALQDDLHAGSGAPTADSHTPADVELDNTTLREALETRVEDPLTRWAIDEAYVAEYGRETDEQSYLNFLLFIHLDKRSKFTPFGVFSDERFHLVGGNDQIPERIRQRLPASALRTGMRLVRVGRLASGDVELTFREGSRTRVFRHDVVVLAIPFTVLREVEMDLDPAVPDEAAARLAIDGLGYGDNAKMMVQFNGPHWATLDPRGTGTAYAELDDVQTTWETNPSLATSSHAVLTDYSGGARGAGLNPNAVQAEAEAFLADLDLVFPGASAAAFRDSKGQVRAHLEHWPSNPLTKGSYSCYLPGQFTTIAGNEGKPVGNILFAGEHANSFYEFQGFMEGAALSGLAAAAEIARRVKAGALP